MIEFAVDDVDELLFQTQKDSYQVVQILKDDEFLEISHNWTGVDRGGAYSVKHCVKGRGAEWYSLGHNELKEKLIGLHPFTVKRLDDVIASEEGEDDAGVDVICVRIYLVSKVAFVEIKGKLTVMPAFTWQHHDNLLALAQIVLLNSHDEPLSSHRVGISGSLKVIQNQFVKVTDEELWEKVKTEVLRTYKEVTQVTGKLHEPYHGLMPSLHSVLREEYGLHETPFEKTLIREEYDGSGEVIRQTYVIDSE